MARCRLRDLAFCGCLLVLFVEWSGPLDRSSCFNHWIGRCRRSFGWHRIGGGNAIVAPGGVSLFAGTVMAPLLWLISTVFIWRESPAERTNRTNESGRHTIVCPTCGYTLNGLSEARCPECGTRYTLEDTVAARIPGKRMNSPPVPTDRRPQRRWIQRRHERRRSSTPQCLPRYRKHGPLHHAIKRGSMNRASLRYSGSSVAALCVLIVAMIAPPPSAMTGRSGRGQTVTTNQRRRDYSSSGLKRVRRWHGKPRDWAAGTRVSQLQPERSTHLAIAADGAYAIALEEKDGKQIWSTRIGKKGGGGISRPAMHADRRWRKVYVLGQFGDLVCLEAATGKEVWHKSMDKDFGGQMMSGWGYAESPLVDGDRLVCTPGGSKGTMVALNKKTGETIWRSAEIRIPPPTPRSWPRRSAGRASMFN